MKDLLFTEEHEWLKKENDETYLVGISDHAQKQLGDIVFVELPELNTKITKGQVFGTVESVKSVSDLYAPISGEILEVNSILESEPELINKDAYKAWIMKIKASNLSEIDSLMSFQEYEDILNK